LKNKGILLPLTLSLCFLLSILLNITISNFLKGYNIYFLYKEGLRVKTASLSGLSFAKALLKQKKNLKVLKKSLYIDDILVRIEMNKSLVAVTAYGKLGVKKHFKFLLDEALNIKKVIE